MLWGRRSPVPTGVKERTWPMNEHCDAQVVAAKWQAAHIRRVVERHRSKLERLGYLPSGYEDARERGADR